MADLSLTAQPRATVGKRVRQLRRAGRLPAVIYGPALDAPQSIQLDQQEFETVYHAAGLVKPIDLTVVGGGSREVAIKDVQYNLLQRRVVHVDFYAGR
jgi:large subunit ribosomal protein L25